MSEAEPQSKKTPPDPGPSGTQPGVPAEDPLAQARAKAEEHREAWLRALADADNARKRAQAEIAQARKFAAERVVEDLLPVMDSLEAALAQESADPAAVRGGVELTRKQLLSALEKAGVTAIGAEPGQKFDPYRHQAMAAVESDAEPNTVASLLQKGYLLHDRVLRPALVTVVKQRVEKEAENPTSNTDLD